LGFPLAGNLASPRGRCGMTKMMTMMMSFRRWILPKQGVVVAAEFVTMTFEAAVGVREVGVEVEVRESRQLQLVVVDS